VDNHRYNALVEDLRGQGIRHQLGGASVITASKFIAEGDFVVVQATGHNATVRGERYENTYCWIIRMHEGKMRELTEYADTQLIESVLRDPHSSK
jgi:ketosteroid isomerase-like protein